MFRPRLVAAVVAAALLQAAPVQSEDLVEVYDLAEQNDPQLRAALQNRLAVQEGLPIARSDLYPQIGAGAGASYSRTDIKSGGPQGLSSIDGTGRNLGLNLTQTIYNRIDTLQVDLAETEVMQADVDYSNAEQDLILRTAQAYFGVLKANAQLQLAEADQAAVQRQLDQAQQRFEVGLIAITDVADAKAQFDSARAQTITARNALNNAMAQLATLTGRSFDTLADVSTSLDTPQPEPADIDAWIDAALAQNLTLQSAQLGSDLARHGVEINRAQRMPTVGLNASYGYNHAPSQSSGSEMETLNGAVELQLEVPLYTSGRINAQTRQATYRFQESIDQVESVRRETRRSTETAYRNVMTNISEISAYRQAVESARTSLAATEAGYEVGTRTIVDVLNAERQVFSAMSLYLDSRYNYILNNLQLKAAAGQLDRNDLLAINQQLEEGEINPLIAPLMQGEAADVDVEQQLEADLPSTNE